MLTISGRTRAVCDGVPRREILQAGGALLPGLSLPGLLAARDQSELRGGPAARAKSVIFLLLFGGPSQLETFDMKPHAAAQIRGPFQPIASRTPGLLISEHLPHLAAVSDRYCVIRTMSHSFNDHSGGGHYIQTGRRWHVPIGGGFSPTPKDWPSVGSVVEYADQQRHGLSHPLPSYMVLPNSLGPCRKRASIPGRANMQAGSVHDIILSQQPFRSVRRTTILTGEAARTTSLHFRLQSSKRQPT